MPLEISPGQGKSRSSAPGAARGWLELLGSRRPSVAERKFFTEQLSLLLETGNPLHAALHALRQQVGNAKMAGVIERLEEQVTEGKPFSEALAAFPELFPGTYVKLVAAAENGGFLHTVLLELSRMDEQREALRRSVSAALSYPAFLLAFSFGVIVFVLLVVFPKFAEMFATIRDDLPVTTLLLLIVSETLIARWHFVLLALGAAGAALTWWFRTPSGRNRLDRWKMTWLGVRSIFIQVYLIQSLRVIGLSLARGVSVPDALASSREVVANCVYREFLNAVEQKVVQGAGFAAAFQQSSFIPPIVKQMISTGEATGNLARVLARVADHYERELEKRLATFARLVEPLMLVVMGGVVGLIVSSLILPIFQLSRAVG